MLPQTEQEHLRALIDALGQAQSAAELRLQRELRDHLRQAVVDATALGFYRNQTGWNQIAILLDEAAKHPIRYHGAWSGIAAMLGELRRKVQALANRGTH